MIHTLDCYHSYHLFQSPNSLLIFSLSQVRNIPFNMNSSSGVLTVQTEIDYEVATSYTVRSACMYSISYSLSLACRCPSAGWLACHCPLYLHSVRWLTCCFPIQFDVLVSDRGENSNSNRSTIMITITDVNDQVPVFPQSAYTVTVPENSGRMNILTLTYTDADTLPDHTRSEIVFIPPLGKNRPIPKLGVPRSSN